MQSAKRHRTSSSIPSERTFNCQKCDKSFSRVENLTRHAENHKPSARFSCGVCDKRFTRSDVLKRHLRLHPTIEDQRPATVTDATPHLIRESPTEHTGASHRQPEIKSPAIYTSMQAPWTGGTAGRNDPECYTTATSRAYDSPLSHQSYPTLPDGCYGIYGEGSFDADLAWILDMAPPACMTTASLPVHEYPSHVNALPINTEGRAGGGSSTTVDNNDHWPDADGDGNPEPLFPPQAPVLVVPDADGWVDAHELLSMCTLDDGPAPHLAVDADTRARILTALQQESSVHHGLLPPDDGHFPTSEILGYFLRLFFEHVHPRFPAIHRNTFAAATAPPFLLLAMMLLGSSYSRSDRKRFVAVYLRPVVTMFSRIQALDTSFLRETDNILSLLFLCTAATWSGQKFAFEFAEGARGILVTACRRCRLLDCRPKPLSPPCADEELSRSMRGKLQQSWRSWIGAEQRKRLGLSIYLFDLQFPALFYNQPYISKAETVNLVLPCHETFWEAKSAAAWKVLLGPAEIPPSTYFMVPLDTCLLYPAIERKPPYAPIDPFSKTLLMYALFTHIFEWRQSLNLVLHSAFIRGSEGTGPGEGLVERQTWLRDALDAWMSAYHTNHSDGAPAPDAALLLHFLARIHLDINVSDLHLFAGRSGLDEDIQLAEDSLRRWCRSGDSARTMHNVQEMLDLAHRTIEAGREPQCGFEVSVALFTGGLMCWMNAKLAAGGSRVQAESQV
ncbi:fungal-specific transcription factor domain-containing protein [Aspergillus multicolor]|uniref:C2H2-type zinc finger protein n=1 Tax=Aspergillus multicolor TaxID=41759 RepID=UPI003CCD2AB8